MGNGVRLPAGPFSPTQIAGLKLWLKADSLVLSNNDPVATWADSSGNGNDVTQGTGGLRPLYKASVAGLNNKPTVEFDGTDDVLTNTGLLTGGNFPTSTATLFIVFSPLNIGGGGGVQYGITATGSATDEFGRFSDGAGYSAYFRSVRIDTYPAAMPAPDSGANLLTVVSGTGAGNYQIYLKGVGQGAQSPSWGIPVVFKVGADSNAAPNPLNGDVPEVLIYNSALSAGNRAQVESYLMTKYAIV